MDGITILFDRVRMKEKVVPLWLRSAHVAGI